MTLPMTTLTIIIRACVCFNALVSYPVQILACFGTIERLDYFKEGSNCLRRYRRIVWRSIIIILISAMSLLLPNFTDFINIIGAIDSSVLSFILP